MPGTVRQPRELHPKPHGLRTNTARFLAHGAHLRGPLTTFEPPLPDPRHAGMPPVYAIPASECLAVI